MFRRFVQLNFVMGVFLSAAGCASSSGGTNYSMGSEPDVWDQSTAHPAAFDAFVVRKNMPIGTKNNAIFYFKSCTEVGPNTWFSKTSYECTEP